ncbi:hypothetical protein BDB01DRAFT_794791 [Pilobolus umbonatus]|nr:hypothetical protein BDB01DRAFT_794791 [Pilobolus umbonatus]
MNMTVLYSFGYNAFQQTDVSTDSIIVTSKETPNYKRVLFTSWETTILLDNNNHPHIWGYQASWFSNITTDYSNRDILSIVGDPNRLMCVIDTHHHLSLYSPTQNKSDCMVGIKEAVYLGGYDSLFILNMEGAVYQYNVDMSEERVWALPKIRQMTGSNNHVLFFTNSSLYPVYGMGYNRLSQLGLDYQQQEVTEPVSIEYFCGIGLPTHGSCHQFHSAVVIGGDVYTFGWSKDGRLGWGIHGDDNDDIISMGIFMDGNNKPMDVHVIKVSCGINHTIAIDGNKVVLL